MFKETLELPPDRFNTLGNMLTFAFSLAPRSCLEIPLSIRTRFSQSTTTKRKNVGFFLDYMSLFKYFPYASHFGEKYVHRRTQGEQNVDKHIEE